MASKPRPFLAGASVNIASALNEQTRHERGEPSPVTRTCSQAAERTAH